MSKMRRMCHSLTANGLGLVAVGDFERLLLNTQQKLIRTTQLN